MVVLFQIAGVRVRAETPSDRLTPTEPSTDSGCSAIDRLEPPNSTLAPTPTPTPTALLTPAYVPASLPRIGPADGANTPHAMAPPAVMPRSSPMDPMTP